MPKRHTKETREKIGNSLAGRTKPPKHIRKKEEASASPMVSSQKLQPVPVRLRPDQIESLELLVSCEKSWLIRTSVDLFLNMIHIKEYTPEQAAAIAQYQKIGAKFPVGVIFIFNPQTLGGTFFCNSIPKEIATPEELAEAWKKCKAIAP